MVNTVCVTAITQSTSTWTTKWWAAPASVESVIATEKTATKRKPPVQKMARRRSVENHERVHEAQPDEDEHAGHDERDQPRQHERARDEPRNEEPRPGSEAV